jgi:hypothetical protein
MLLFLCGSLKDGSQMIHFCQVLLIIKTRLKSVHTLHRCPLVYISVTIL